jgi:hypothetical protein
MMTLLMSTVSFSVPSPLSHTMACDMYTLTAIARRSRSGANPEQVWQT